MVPGRNNGELVTDEVSLMQRGRKGLPVWSVPTDKLLQLHNECSDRKVSEYTAQFVHLPFMWVAGYLCVSYLGNTWHEGSFREEGKPEGAGGSSE